METMGHKAQCKVMSIRKQVTVVSSVPLYVDQLNFRSSAWLHAIMWIHY